MPRFIIGNRRSRISAAATTSPPFLTSMRLADVEPPATRAALPELVDAGVGKDGHLFLPRPCIDRIHLHPIAVRESSCHAS